MSITPPTGILDITDAIVRVSKLEFRGATGFDTILNNVARNTALLVDQNVEYTTDKAWGLKLPNAWVSEFDAYWASGASGNIDFNIYNNTTSGTNGYVISMDDTTITVTYDGGSALKTVSLGSTLKNDTWRKIHILFERDMISLALDGTPVLYFKDTLLRPRVYDEESGYVIASGLSADRKVKNLRILNGDKWMTDNTSNIAFVHGNVGIGTTQAAYTLDVKGDIRATGNLLIEGLTTTVDTQNLSIEDAIVEIGRGNDGGTSGKDVGFLFTRNNGADTTNSNVALVYDESTDRLTFGYSDGSPTDSTLAINTSKSLDVVIPSGNLGIGTASPALDLHVMGGIMTENNGAITPQIQFKSGSNNTNGWLVRANISDTFAGDFTIDRQDNSVTPSKFVIKNGGNVGIGTTSPNLELHVHDANNAHSGIILSSTTGYHRLYEASGQLYFQSGTAASADSRADINFTSMYASTTYMKILGSNGNVGIGTNPGAKLDVFSSSTDPGAVPTLHVGDGAIDYGDYGMLQLTRHATTGGSKAHAAFIRNGNTVFGMGFHNNTNTFGFWPSFTTVTNAPAMSFATGGNVGIGTADPNRQLQIYGNSSNFFSFSPAEADDTDIVDYTNFGATSFKRQMTMRLNSRNWYWGIVNDASNYLGLAMDGGGSPDPDIQCVFQNNGTFWTKYIRTKENVGIGTDNANDGKLEIQGYIYKSLTAHYYSSAGNHATTTATRPLSIYASHHIACSELQVFSDRRIKKNIVDADDAECLEVLRLLKPKRYQYKDEVDRGTEPVWGFIAQEVRETLPYATSLGRGVVPNIYELANVSQSNVITFTNFNTSNLESNATTLIRTTGIDGEDHDIHLAEVIDEHTIRVEEDLTEWIGSVDETGNVVAGNQLFIYGQRVDDFVSLQKSAIFTIATSALQEVDRQLQAEKAKVATLETQLASVLARLDALESA
jgi:hypothetical protein